MLFMILYTFLSLSFDISLTSVGKSTMLSVIGHREIPIPDHFDIYHLKSEMEASDKTALECVMEVDDARLKLEKEAEELAHCGEDNLAHDRFELILLDLFCVSYELTCRDLLSYLSIRPISKTQGCRI